MERVKGIEPSSQAWEAHILPLNHTRLKEVPNTLLISHDLYDGNAGVYLHSEFFVSLTSSLQ